jgi:hypothetical protein
MERDRAKEIGFQLALYQVECEMKDGSIDRRDADGGLEERVLRVGYRIGIQPDELAEWVAEAREHIQRKWRNEREAKLRQG